MISLHPNRVSESVMSETRSHLDFMMEAIRLASEAGPDVLPNPLVGAVIVREDKDSGSTIIGRGFHRGRGTDHAEVVAIRQAGERSRGSRIYVTLEPCNHFGKTPPCTNAILKAGIAEVYVASLDPNLEVEGQGASFLRTKGVVVHIGLGHAEERAMNHKWHAFIRTSHKKTESEE